MAKSAALLKDYLVRLDFYSIYKYLVGGNNYFLNPAIITNESKAFISLQLRQANIPPFLDLLLFLEPLELDSLSAEEKELAHALDEQKFIKIWNGTCQSTGFQLISFSDYFLLIDGRVNFPSLGLHKSYIGIDSYLMLYYISKNRFNRNSICLDICSGTGIGALFSASFSDNVTAIELDDFALNLIEFNRTLNSKENEIHVVNHDLFTYKYPENNYDLITCNPPFVLIPDEFGGPLYAKGFGKDGLDHLRFLVNNTGSLLKDNGVAYYVADLLGDNSNPFFVSELENISFSKKLEITVFIDNKIDVRTNVKALTSLCHGLNPALNRDSIRQRVSSLIVKKMGATHYYLTTILIRKSSNMQGLKKFDRMKFLTSEGEFKNVVSLPTA